MIATRRLFTALALLAASNPACSQERNIVLFVADDLGQTLGCYGDSVARTPNMDRLAAAGTLFRLAFCTTASCSASRSVILTGLHNHANGQYGHQHSFHHFSSFDKIRSLPVRLAEKGYRTARVGKYHLAPESVYRFETVLRAPSRNPVRMAEACRSVIESEDERPFFLYFCTSDPHRGGGFARELPYSPNRFGNKPPGQRYPDIEPRHFDPDKVIVPGFLPDTRTCRAELAQYYQSVARLDQGFGRLVEILQKSGRWKHTLVMLISDHGIAFPGAKTTVYEGGLRSPLLVRNPYQHRHGVVSRAMISWVDITPTLLDFAGLEPSGVHGRSFLSILEQSDPHGWDEIFASHTFHEIQMYYPMRAVRERRYKLIWNIASPLPFPFATDLLAAPTWRAQVAKGPGAPYGARTVGNYVHRPPFELYDLEKDPYEGHNLAAEPELAAELTRLKKKIKEYQRRTGDPWISKWDYE